MTLPIRETQKAFGQSMYLAVPVKDHREPKEYVLRSKLLSLEKLGRTFFPDRPYSPDAARRLAITGIEDELVLLDVNYTPDIQHDVFVGTNDIRGHAQVQITGIGTDPGQIQGIVEKVMNLWPGAKHLDLTQECGTKHEAWLQKRVDLFSSSIPFFNIYQAIKEHLQPVKPSRKDHTRFEEGVLKEAIEIAFNEADYFWIPQTHTIMLIDTVEAGLQRKMVSMVYVNGKKIPGRVYGVVVHIPFQPQCPLASDHTCCNTSSFAGYINDLDKIMLGCQEPNLEFIPSPEGIHLKVTCAPELGSVKASSPRYEIESELTAHYADVGIAEKPKEEIFGLLDFLYEIRH